ncbi:multicopper oxidase domain-containing protein [Pseudonocardia endophytica]|uniref:Multicopper oxidase n=1 Tax=Pseudonocardia endophytica TaxID=401976 RepID=A0A4R1HSW6_PSEEN|nr:multicopper oxidase domain-containing protein [Pseudonocardia endophytica]TCK20492.1 multicopper oxidase [Pseudonocardia endophytica]
MPERRRYEITALEFPIVYTGDGDHDRNGLLYTPDAFVPLLKWARDRWRADDEWLPEAHRRDQLIGLLLDGRRRYDVMAAILRSRAAEDFTEVLAYRGPAPGPEAGEEEPDLGVDPRRREVEQNFRATVNELAAVLDELTNGAIRTVPALFPPGWTERWRSARAVLRDAIDRRLREIDKEWVRDRPGLARRSGLTESDVDRLLLNDVVDPDGVGVRYDRVNPLRPLPLVRPLVLRARLGEHVEVRLRNETGRPRVGLHRQGAGLMRGIRKDDGARVGRNPDSTATRENPYTYQWAADTEGVWPINDLADVRGTEDGTNVHGLFGAFVVEPAATWWRDPETGRDVTDSPLGTASDVDVIPRTLPSELGDFVDFASDGDLVRPHREFTIFIHDEPEVHSALHIGGGEHTVMPLNYRAEPMPNRLPHKMREFDARTRNRPVGHAGIDDRHADTPIELRAVQRRIDRATLAEEFWVGRRDDGSFVERVAGEEQHHSSWLFGDPVTPILRAYRGDPCRVRLVHAGIKETHVFHLHVHQWRAVATDTAPPSTWNPRRGSQLLDSITIGPQTGFTIDPLYGSGSRQHLFGDVIWHCHLYPHFHHGMWGLWRSLDEVVDEPTRLPDGTPCAPLVPLPGRAPENAPEPGHPSFPSRGERVGFPWFIDAGFPQKSPPPPAATPDQVGGRRRLLDLPDASRSEVAAFAPGAEARPGAPFIDLDGLSARWNADAALPVAGRLLSYDVVVRHRRVDYNTIGWHDRRGHFYELFGVSVTEDGRTRRRPLAGSAERREPFFVRANHGDVVELRLHNDLGTVGPDHFDPTQLPVECGLHVHLVKFDVLAADGSATGWNYLSGASCREAVREARPGALPARVGLHRWVVDEEFGPCFFHDHLLANYRQKHGLFAALIAEPPGSTWTSPRSAATAWSGSEAVVAGAANGVEPFREAGLGVGDFVPLYDGDDEPLNPPGELGGDDDPGVMAVNYRNAPLTARGPDPSQWFATDDRRRDRDRVERDDEASWLRDPDTPIIEAHPGERLRIRLIQGSHEEQHSFVTHGLRWRRDWGNPRSTLVNQQTLGISEAFTLHMGEADTPFGLGDHLWRFSAMDDLWLGCWGLVRVLPDGQGPPRIEGTVAPRPRKRPATPDRDWVVRARRVEHEYDGHRLTDPFGLVYEVVRGDIASPYRDDPSGGWLVSGGDRPGRPEPLVLRCAPGEWVRIRLLNEVLLPRAEQRPDNSDEWVGPFEDPLLPRFGPEPDPPPLPLNPERRTVSPRVSLHPSLLLYDVTTDDGAYVGSNRNSTVRPLPVGDDHGHGADDGAVVDGAGHGHERGNWREYWWYADEALGEGDGQVCYLHDMADVRNHRHHGLVGAIVVEPRGWVPEHDSGAHTTIRWWGRTRDEHVLFWQDGLRHYVYGDLTAPVRDVEPGDDPEDAGQKGVSYRTAPVHPRDQLSDPGPSTPAWTAPRGDLVLRLVGACDKPRNHTFTVHGAQWTAAPWVDGSPQVGALSGLTADVVHDIVPILADPPGDHAYRSGAFRWSVSHGMRGIIRRS